jgi:hypothetical protein
MDNLAKKTRLERVVRSTLSLLFIVSGYISVLAQEGAISTTGTVDWNSGVVRVKGIGGVNPNDPPSAQRAGALRVAKMDAWRNFLELIKGVQVDAQTTVQNYMLSDDRIRSSVEGTITNFRQIGDPHYLSDGSIEIEYEMSLRGSLAGALLPSDMGSGRPLSGELLTCPTCGRAWPHDVPVPAGVTLNSAPSVLVNPTGRAYTGLILDARGLSVNPAMAPKILNSVGDQVYGTGFVSREYALQVGIVGYARNLEAARQDSRVADNPLLIRALSVAGKGRTDLVISDQDALALHSLSENLSFLEKCQVMFLVD